MEEAVEKRTAVVTECRGGVGVDFKLVPRSLRLKLQQSIHKVRASNRSKIYGKEYGQRILRWFQNLLNFYSF